MTGAAGLLNGRHTSPRGPHVDEIRRKDKKETGYGQLWARDASHPVVQKLRLSTFKVWTVATSNALAKADFTFEASHAELAAKANLHVRTVSKAINQLRALGLIETTHNWGTHPGWHAPGWKRTNFKLLRPTDALSDQDLLRVVVLPRKGPYADDAPLSVAIYGPRERRRWARERARQEAEVAANVSALNLLPALERACGLVGKLEEQIQAWPEVPRPHGPGRFIAPDAVGEAWTARALVQAARATCWEAWSQLLWVTRRLTPGAELAEGESWALVYGAARVAVELGGMLAGVVARAQRAVDVARAGWMALVRHPDAVERGQGPPDADEGLDAEAREEEPQLDDEPPPRPGEPWRPPRCWDPYDHDRSKAAWEDQAQQYRDASEIGGRLGEKIRAGLLQQGFRPDWPEPGLSALLAASGRGPPSRRR